MSCALQRHRSRITDQPLPLIAVGRVGLTTGGIDAEFGPDDLLRAWQY